MNSTATSLVETYQFDDDEQDALREVVNIAMGRAGASLAQILDTFVHLSVPFVRIASVNEVSGAIGDMLGQETNVIAVRQAFYNSLRGEAMIIFDRKGSRALAGLMGYDKRTDGYIEQEVLLDVSNVLVGACLGGVADQFDMQLSYYAPAIMFEGGSVGDLLKEDCVPWTHALLLEIEFEVEGSGINCHMVILTPEESIGLIREQLHTILESI